MPPAARPLFFGANLIAFRKKDGGTRPIAVGLMLRRLVARAACAAVRDRAAELLAPIQVDLGVRGGAEAAVHAARRFLDLSGGTSGLLKLDFENAFNTVHRQAVLSACMQHLPDLARLAYSAYGGNSVLLFGDHRLESAFGVQQGDPLGHCCSLWPFAISPTMAKPISGCGTWTTLPLAAQRSSWSARLCALETRRRALAFALMTPSAR